MVHNGAEVQHVPLTAVVLDSDVGRLTTTSAALTAAGFQVFPASNPDSLAISLEHNHPSIVVVENALAHGLRSPGIPVLLLLNAGDSVDLEEAEAWRVVDYVINPVRPDELVHRVNTLIGRSRERSRSRNHMEALRESLRNVSAAIRETNDPQLIADHVVRGFGEALGVDHVWFATFRDERVPSIRAQWNAPGTKQLPAKLGNSENAIAELSNRLWTEADAMTVLDHREEPASRITQALREWSPELQPVSTVILPVGEGASALGVVLLCTENRIHDWTRPELSLMQHVAGNVAHGLIQGHLISAQQRVLQQLRQLDKAKTDFLATVNHELRTPLTSITAYLDMIRDGSGGPVPDGIKKMLDVIARNSDRLRRLIEDMLTVSMQDGSNLDLKPVDVDKLLQVVVATLRPLAESRHVDISYVEASEDIEVTADEAKLEQVFTNIVANAIKFTPEGGRVGITSVLEETDDGGHAALVRVADTGLGIPEHDLPHIFTRFYRASNATSAAVPGSGLGLAIAHDIISRHMGRLNLDSTLGAGTTVSIELPVGGP
ncbi:histidine kinase [Paenarthrobacter ureafaciens]|uniref:ATP-binding protein n=1 Tax=Paenarthrobacter ureafaciens TaxID=37931 RepID=UPI0015B864B2|nr:GAF domain-containing sensor histidine kinase [Paenarthrobacter ureafaciens]MEC3850849.1 ATP-binding protein [Paenarthrobacter ureafaciens]NWL26499.1 histidine kinase [Paenarthrobacter ureafaciens]